MIEIQINNNNNNNKNGEINIIDFSTWCLWKRGLKDELSLLINIKLYNSRWIYRKRKGIQFNEKKERRINNNNKKTEQTK
jgi:hypothetical protein